MRRYVAFLVFAALTSTQLVALRCDMGASAHQAAGAHEAAAAHRTGAHTAATRGAGATHAGAATRGTATHTNSVHPTTARGQAIPASHPATQHGDRDGCQMMMACGAASIRAVRTVAVAGIPTPFVRAASFAAAIPVAADLAVEPPPPRHTV